MFSGIVEATSTVVSSQVRRETVQITVAKPNEFNDLTIGDSIATNGVCLTVEAFDQHTIQFTLGAETLRVTGWTGESLQGQVLNLERSLRLGDRIHGHLVTGHVDVGGQVVKAESQGECLYLRVALLEASPYLWQKGSVTINGVSLTVNEVTVNQFAVGLIPETLRRTNLGKIKVGQSVNIEFDYFAKALASQARR